MLISIAQAQLFFLALTRIMAMIIQVPVLGGQAIPTQVRLGLGLVLAAVLIPWQPLGADAKTLELAVFAVGVLKELIIGTLAAFAASLTFGAVQIAAEAMGLESGFGSGRIFNPALGEGGSDYSQFFIMFSMLVFLLIDGHHMFILAMQRTFDAIPINGPLPLGSLDALGLMTARLIAAGIRMALPVMAALFITDMALGLIARVAPQMQIFFLGMPLKVGVSLISLAILFLMILPTLSDLFRNVGDRMLLLLGSR
jgi:flagellar biosynthesis protein FliR